MSACQVFPGTENIPDQKLKETFLGFFSDFLLLHIHTKTVDVACISRDFIYRIGDAYSWKIAALDL